MPSGPRVVGGMLSATFIDLFFIPLFYVLVCSLFQEESDKQQTPEHDPESCKLRRGADMTQKHCCFLGVTGLPQRLHHDPEIHPARSAGSRRLAQRSGLQRDPIHAGRPGRRRPAMAGILHR